MPTDPIRLTGAPGSPYTRKMLAVLRYRHLPYRFFIRNSPAANAMPAPPVQLLPTFYLPDAAGVVQAVVDSTPLIRRLEREHVGRAVLPADPVIGFLDDLLEDYADEWLTKPMFHYRWHYAADIERAGEILPRWRDITGSDAVMAKMKAQFSQRQISRLGVVGSSAVTAPVIEGSYRRFLAALDAHLHHYPFLMGGRPGASDFATYGQLTQLTHFDPTPMALTLAQAPRVFAWVDLVDDLSGLEVHEDGWIRRDAIPETLRALLAEVGRTYVPVMLANARALAACAERVELEVDGLPWVQQPFPYQGKCVAWLREAWNRLGEGDRGQLSGLLEETGCLPLVTP
ncbi:MAG: glutathione S-transferase N-terminal domain-containing protein [Burkholderiaceae bacterium]|nr:glutathione S-transferase N-terminal domain-containing protein [Burkholderiaceae bacterium]